MVPELRRTVPPAAELADYDRAARARTVPSQHTAVAWWVSCQASDQVSVYRERKTGDPAVMARIRNYFDGRNGMPPAGDLSEYSTCWYRHTIRLGATQTFNGNGPRMTLAVLSRSS